MQGEGALAPSMQNEPSGHGAHVAEPIKVAYVPTEHGKHAALALVAANVPALHAVQPEPSALALWPGAHGVHVSCPLDRW